MRISDACVSTFARHETFHPRWGWIRKAYIAAQDPETFRREDATLRLGVGKNMVRAIRFWGHAFRVLANDDRNSRAGLSVRTKIGRAIFDDEAGWDPFTEDPGTLWLLHWLLMAPHGCLVPVWWAIFNEFDAVEFTQQELISFVVDRINSVPSWKTKPSRSSIEKDVGCLLRTYAPSTGTARRQPLDDTIDSPMRDLGLFRVIDPGARIFRFVIGQKPTLPPEIVLYACADFLARTSAGSSTVLVSRLASEPGAPGKVFKLREADLVDLIERALETVPFAAIARPAGTTQLVLGDDPALLASSSVATYYASHRAVKSIDSGIFAGAAAESPCREAQVT